ncbi:MAG: hypothetical protein CMP23_13920 [Rickettsiales bacterium]|nr:hypothetical protein [Rickettsiales bacterium]
MRRLSLLHTSLLLAALLVAAGCGPDLTEGMSAGDCTDGADNDGDGAFDCLDDGCVGSPDCAGDDDDTSGDDDDSSVTDDDDSSVTDDDDSSVADDDDSSVADDDDTSGDDDDDSAVTPPDPETGIECADGADNDEDGLIDCADDGCSSWFQCTEDSLLGCQDGVDNDGDSLIDCADDGCSTQPHCREQGNCSDELDNDGDGLVDCFDTVDCGNSGDCMGTPEDCTDPAGNDEDGDGQSNCADPDCSGQATCQEGLFCNDSIDNDNDGAVDCADSDCAGVSTVCLETLYCSDGLDNDLDGSVDCADSDCAAQCSSAENCSDGQDNDGDGNADCDDTDCVGVCLESLNCADGQDNDGDGNTDCDDSECAGATNCFENCNLVGDEDGNGQADCDDSACAQLPACIVEEDCNATGDEDGNGLAECTDPACWAVLTCPEDCGSSGDEDNDGAADCNDNDCTNACSEICNNNIDDDADTLIDCLDEECSNGTSPLCVEDSYGLCNDNNVDNDGDGFANCDDSDCAAVVIPGTSTLLCVPEICNDVQDNNGNGLADCDDPQCWQSGNPFGCPEICDSGATIDEDSDGLANCADPDCSTDTNCPEDCSNGVDDDADGAIDCNDSECGTVSACIPEDCSNGVDDDADGAVDCLDDECTNGASSSCVENTEALCTDGDDNDGDGLTNCDDNDCAGVLDSNGDVLCGEALCNDGNDNDGDGFVDCDDPHCCLAANDPQGVCVNVGVCVAEDCTPGSGDEDANNLADCDDPACTSVPVCQNQPWQGAVTVLSSSTPCTIPANGTVDCELIAGDVNSDSSTSAYIANPMQIQGMDVGVTISHPSVEDLVLTLLDCGNVDLSVNNPSGGSGANYTATIFDQQAGQSITSGSPPFTGNFQPESSLFACNGYDLNGTWTLRVDNNGGSSSGSIQDWSIAFDLGELYCANGSDDNADGQVDCADPTCGGNPNCGGTGPEDCSNGTDDDGDGDVDCADQNCSGLPSNPTGLPHGTCELPIEATCDDGFDNDGNGAADCGNASDGSGGFLPADPQCNGSPACQGGEATFNGATCDSSSCINCNDGNDNDGDGNADCGGASDNSGNPLPADPSCEAISGVCGGGGVCDGSWSGEEDASGAGCDDGCDNDGDGMIDCDDDDCCVGPNPDCANASQCNSGGGGGGEMDCLASGTCPGSATDPNAHPCEDGLDNDNDIGQGGGGVDCNDADCTQMDPTTGYSAFIGCGDEQACTSLPTNHALYCADPCADGVDNDGDGTVDCSDQDCAAEAHCMPTGEGTTDCHDFDLQQCFECFDGIDNDGDGTGSSPGNGVWTSQNVSSYDSSAPIDAGADCFDDLSINCANNPICRICANHDPTNPNCETNCNGDADCIAGCAETKTCWFCSENGANAECQSQWMEDHTAGLIPSCYFARGVAAVDHGIYPACPN